MSIDQQPYGSSRVCDVPEQLRPRELFDRVGAKNVPDDVLLAIILRNGTVGLSVIDLARDMLKRYKTLTGVARAPAEELIEHYAGLGPVKVQILKASFELAQRLKQEGGDDGIPVLDSPEAVALLLREDARTLEKEIFWCLLLDSKNRLMREPIDVSKGTLNASLVHPREVFSEAVRKAAAGVIVAHNHPSGDPTPSPEDIRATRKLVEAGRLLDIQVLDHVIVGRGRADEEWFVSLRESGLVEFD